MIDPIFIDKNILNNIRGAKPLQRNERNSTQFRQGQNDETSNTNDLSGVDISDIARYNPFQELNRQPVVVPVSFFETLSILRVFNPITCNQGIDASKFVYVDLDITEGFSMAMQGRFPKSLCYALSSKRWNFSRNGMNWKNFELESSTYESILERVLDYNCRGINISYCSQDDSDIETETRINTCMLVLQSGGMMILRLTNPETSHASCLWNKLSYFFGKLTLYKPATTMCLTMECYLIAENRRIKDGTQASGDFEEQLSLIREYKHTSIKGIKQYKDNRALYDIDRAMIEYMGTL